MRQLFMLIVLAAAGYLGYNYYQTHYAHPEEAAEEVAAAPATGEPQKMPEPAATPRPFKSKIPIAAGAPNEKHLAPPGIFYMRERVSAETPTGIHAVGPGDQVALLKRNADGTLKLTHERVEFTANESQVTNDLDVAQDVEHQEFLKRGGR